jgi:hypothetical protein
MIVLLTALLSACGLPIVPGATSATAPTPTVTPVPTVSPDKGGPTTLPALAGTVVHCAQVAGFQNAHTANAGAASSDVPFPPNSVSADGAASDALYHFQVVNVCSDGSAAQAVLVYYVSQMGATGWKTSATYPYGGEQAHACGDPYCWRKPGKLARYVSLEHLSSSGAVAIYSLRIATAPAAPAAVVVRSASGAARGGAGLTVSASCQNGEQMLGGGYSIGSSNHTYSANSSYPSGPAIWTVSAVASGSDPLELQTYVGCVRAIYSLDIKVVPATFQVAAGTTPQAVIASCGGGVLTGGGVQIAGAGAIPADSAPAPDLTGWSAVPTAGSGGAKGTVYAVCAGRNVDAGPSTSRAFTIGGGMDMQDPASLGCTAGQWLTSGGYRNADASADGKIVYGLNGPTADYSRWFLQGHNLDTASAHGASIWVVCVVPDPQF